MGMDELIRWASLDRAEEGVRTGLWEQPTWQRGVGQVNTWLYATFYPSLSALCQEVAQPLVTSNEPLHDIHSSETISKILLPYSVSRILKILAFSSSIQSKQKLLAMRGIKEPLVSVLHCKFYQQVLIFHAWWSNFLLSPLPAQS